MDTDETDGEHTIHFDGKYEDCEMKVKVVNGKREGKAIVWKRGKKYLTVTYRNGVVDGMVERMNRKGDVELRGVLVNGVESGLFEEMRGGEVVWKGYYRNGERYSEVVKSRRGGRWYVERRVGSGEWVV